MHISEIKNLLNSPLIMLLLIIINDVHLCEDIDHVNAVLEWTHGHHVIGPDLVSFLVSLIFC